MYLQAAIGFCGMGELHALLRQVLSLYCSFRAPKTASKRVFLITDDDNPHPGSKQLLTSARTTLLVCLFSWKCADIKASFKDLTQSGAQVEPFFIATPEKPFDPSKFYSVRGICL